MLKKSAYISFLFLYVSIIPDISFAEERKPIDVVRELVESIRMIKDESTIKLTPEESKNNKKFIKKANSVIDISGLGPKTLGSHWEERTQKEKANFLTTLTELFGRVAYPKSAKFFIELEIKYNSEKIKKGKSEVKTTMEHESEGLIEIDYKLHKVKENWLIYDVILDEVSLALNLRTKFHQVVDEESFEELVNRMKRRLEKEN